MTSLSPISGTAAALPKVLKNGLKRANQGTEQIQNALDAMYDIIFNIKF